MGVSFDTLPAVLREPTERWFERFGEGGPVDDLVRLAACSEFAGAVAIREKGWLLGNLPVLHHAPDARQLDAFVSDIAVSDADLAEVQSQLRQYRNRYMLHVIWREVFGLASLDETLLSLSRLADRLLDAACRYAEKVLAPRYGLVRDAAGRKVPLVILGMGKLGGRELNLSSDIDLIFLFPEAGETDGLKQVSAQEYFGRLSRKIIALLDETTVDGFVFRIDTRLRPLVRAALPS